MRGRWLVVGLLSGVLALSSCSSGSDDVSSSGSSATTVGEGRKFPLIAPLGLRPILDRERRRSSATPTTTTPPTTLATPPTTAAAPPPRTTPYFVGQLHRTFVDPTRSSPARGGTPASDSRTIRTTIYYPTTLAPSPTNPTPPCRDRSVSLDRVRARIRDRCGGVCAVARGSRVRRVHRRGAGLSRDEHRVLRRRDSQRLARSSRATSRS